MTRPFEFAELQALVEALCEETITPAQMRRLEELLLAHPEAEAFYVQYRGLYADLSRHFAEPASATEQTLRGRLAGGTPEQPAPPAVVTPPAPARRLVPRRWLAVWGGVGLTGLAAGLLIVLMSGRGPRTGPTPPEQAAEPSDNTVAVLLHTSGAEWGDNDQPTRVGSPLAPGWLYLKAGFAQIQFYNGAAVILEGPADFRLISRTEAYCARGKLRATVPTTAQGFTIGTPKYDLVDRGTEFGVRVGAGDRTEVHVFQGKVDLYDAGNAGRPDAAVNPLTTGAALRLDGPGRVSPIKPDPAAFQTAQGLADRFERESQTRQAEWVKLDAALRADPTLALYYSFQGKHQSWTRSLPDDAGRLKAVDGAIVGCSWAPGRWSGRHGLEFNRVSDRVRVHVPGEYESITMAAWVRVDALPNRFNSLFMTDGWEPGAPHWHISNSGKIELGVQGGKGKGNYHYLTADVLPPDRLGEWVHLAVTYDGDAGLVTHYVDGRAVKEEEIQFETVLRFGDAELGNWNTGKRANEKSPVRYFNGLIDEFLLFSRALSAAEVEKIHSQGLPPS